LRLLSLTTASFAQDAGSADKKDDAKKADSKEEEGKEEERQEKGRQDEKRRQNEGLRQNEVVAVLPNGISASALAGALFCPIFATNVQPVASACLDENLTNFRPKP
jgi:hypothetical protein